jgi:signal transduction histidine kinase
MTTKLVQELTKLKQGDHICSIYEKRGEQLAVSVPFIMNGLARGERCSYIIDDSTIEEVVQALATAGVDVEQERQRGALRILTRQETYLSTGEFVPQALLDFLRQAEAEALADGFSGLRQMGEMTWVLGPEPGCDRLIEFEALVDQWLANSKTTGMCHYNRLRFDAPCIHDVFRTHPMVILGDQLCPNPYHEPPEMILRKDQPEMTPEFRAKRVEWWIAQLERTRVTEREQERAQEAVRESHRLLRVVLDTLPVGVAVVDRAGDILLANAASKRIWGGMIVSGDERWARSKGYWHDSGKMIEPKSWASARALFEGQTTLNELIDIETHDGQQKTIQNSAAPIRNAEGLILQAVVVNEDVTERVRAEEALRDSADRLQRLSRRLLEVQEEERRHLARELHDEVGQMLTGMGLILKSNADLTTNAARAGFEQVRVLVDELLERVRQLSFDLRPAVLDQLGLLPGLLALFERYTRQTGVLVDFKHQGVDGRFAPEVETTAYRIVQETLTNVARHAGVAGVTVRAWTTKDMLSVQIEDRGHGFDLEAVLATPRSSGLVGIQERVTLLGGRLTIESRPGAGTQITAELPLSEVGQAIWSRDHDERTGATTE